MSSKRKGDTSSSHSKSHRHALTDEQKTYNMMHDLPLDLVHKVTTMIPRQDCSIITARSKLCANATIYRNQNGALKDCSLYCIRHIGSWLPKILVDVNRLQEWPYGNEIEFTRTNSRGQIRSFAAKGGKIYYISIIGRYSDSIARIQCHDCQDIDCFKLAVRDLSIKAASLLSRNKGIDDDYAVGFQIEFMLNVFETDEEDEDGDLRYPNIKSGIYTSDISLPNVFNRGIIKVYNNVQGDDLVDVKIFLPIVWDPEMNV